MSEYVFIVYDEGSQTDGYTLIHDVFSTREKANDFIELMEEDYSSELKENAVIEQMKLT